MVQDTYHGSNPYDAHGPYDDDYHITRPSRPSPVPYDDPYADVPTSDVQVQLTGTNDGPGDESDKGGSKMSRGHMSSRGARGSGTRNRRLWNSSRRGYRHNTGSSRRTFDSDAGQPMLGTSRMAECATGYGYFGEAISPHSLVQPPSNAWLPPETNNIPDYQQPFIQPHINPRFASVFGLNLRSEPIIPWASQNSHSHPSRPQHWGNTWTTHGSAGSEGAEDTYRPM